MITTKAMNQTRATGTEARYMFQPSYNKGKYNTGLDERIANPFEKQEVEYLMDQYGLLPEWRDELKKIIQFPTITKQVYYEILHQRPINFYRTDFNFENSIFKFQKNKSNLKEQSFIDTFNIVLYDRPNRFTDETPRGALAIQLIKNHSKIAASKQLVNPIEHAYYISEENEAEMEKMRKQDLLDDATEAKLNLQRRSTEYKNYQVATLCQTIERKPIVKGVATKDQVKIALNNFIGDGKDQMRNIEKFLDIVELLKSPETKPEFEVRYLVGQAFEHSVLQRRDGYVIWNSQRDTSKYQWNSEDVLIKFLVNEYNTLTPEQTTQNWYQDLFDEVKRKGAVLEQ